MIFAINYMLQKFKKKKVYEDRDFTIFDSRTRHNSCPGRLGPYEPEPDPTPDEIYIHDSHTDTIDNSCIYIDDGPFMDSKQHKQKYTSTDHVFDKLVTTIDTQNDTSLIMKLTTPIVDVDNVSNSQNENTRMKKITGIDIRDDYF